MGQVQEGGYGALEETHKRETQLAWAAGLIDGEGCLQITKNLGGVYLAIEMTHKPTLERIQEILGGTLYDRAVRKDRPHERPTWIWILRDREALRSALRALLPWLVTKFREAEEVLRFIANTTPHARRRYNPEEYEFRESMYWKLRELKRG